MFVDSFWDRAKLAFQDLMMLQRRKIMLKQLQAVHMNTYLPKSLLKDGVQHFKVTASKTFEEFDRAFVQLDHQASDITYAEDLTISIREQVCVAIHI